MPTYFRMLVFFRRGGNRSNRGKTSRSRVENQQQTQNTYRVTLVDCEWCNHYVNPGPKSFSWLQRKTPSLKNKKKKIWSSQPTRRILASLIAPLALNLLGTVIKSSVKHVQRMMVVPEHYFVAKPWDRTSLYLTSATEDLDALESRHETYHGFYFARDSKSVLIGSAI